MIHFLTRTDLCRYTHRSNSCTSLLQPDKKMICVSDRAGNSQIYEVDVEAML